MQLTQAQLKDEQNRVRPRASSQPKDDDKDNQGFIFKTKAFMIEKAKEHRRRPNNTRINKRWRVRVTHKKQKLALSFEEFVKHDAYTKCAKNKKEFMKSTDPRERWCRRTKDGKITERLDKDQLAQENAKSQQNHRTASSSARSSSNSKKSKHSSKTEQATLNEVTYTLPNDERHTFPVTTKTKFLDLQKHIRKQLKNEELYLYLNEEHVKKQMLDKKIRSVLDVSNKYRITVRNVSSYTNNPSGRPQQVGQARVVRMQLIE